MREQHMVSQEDMKKRQQTRTRSQLEGTSQWLIPGATVHGANKSRGQGGRHRTVNSRHAEVSGAETSSGRRTRATTAAEADAWTTGRGGRGHLGVAQSTVTTTVVNDSAILGAWVQRVYVVLADEYETTCQQRIAGEKSSSELVRGTNT